MASSKQKVRPPAVQRLVLRSSDCDPETRHLLQEKGRAGGKRSAEIRKARAAQKQLDLDERTDELAQTESVSPEGDVLPPDTE